MLSSGDSLLLLKVSWKTSHFEFSTTCNWNTSVFNNVLYRCNLWDSVKKKQRQRSLKKFFLLRSSEFIENIRFKHQFDLQEERRFRKCLSLPRQNMIYATRRSLLVDVILKLTLCFKWELGVFNDEQRKVQKNFVLLWIFQNFFWTSPVLIPKSIRLNEKCKSNHF